MTISAMLCLMGMAVFVSGQVSVSLMEMPSEGSAGQMCYRITLSNQGPKAIALAGQNYRLYYDCETASLSELSVRSLLPAQYTPMTLVQHHFDADASGFGVLPYDSHLTFINLATDLNLNGNKALSLPMGKDVAVAQLCFEVAEGATPHIAWAQDNFTHTYATAFGELALLDDAGTTQKAVINKYNDVTPSTSAVQEATVFTTKYFPNPFTDRLTVAFNEPMAQRATVQISNVFGAVLQTLTVDKGATELTISGRDLPEGALLIDIKAQDGQQSVMKAIKIK